MHAPKKYMLGTYAPGSRVQLDAGGWMPGRWIIVVGNYARTTGVVTVRVEDTGAILEKDGRHPLFDVDVINAWKVDEAINAVGVPRPSKEDE